MARCAWCGAEFTPKNRRHRHCSRECQYEHQKADARERYATDPDYKARKLGSNAAYRGRRERGVNTKEALRQDTDIDEAARTSVAALGPERRLELMVALGAPLYKLEKAWLRG